MMRERGTMERYFEFIHCNFLNQKLRYCYLPDPNRTRGSSSSKLITSRSSPGFQPRSARKLSRASGRIPIDSIFFHRNGTMTFAQTFFVGAQNQWNDEQNEASSFQRPRTAKFVLAYLKYDHHLELYG